MPQNASPTAPEPHQPGHPRKLREVPGGYDINRWPIAVPMVDDETLASWLCRTAHRYALTTNRLLHLHRQGDYNHWFTPRWAAEVGDSMGVGVPPDLLWTVWPGSAPAGYPDNTDEKKARRSRFCPACLREDQAWRCTWYSSTAVHCRKHGLLLVDACPACGHQPWATRTWADREAGSVTCTGLVAPPGGGPGRRRRPICGFDLAKATATTAPAAVVNAISTNEHLQRLADDELLHLPIGLRCTGAQARAAFGTLLRLAGGTTAPSRLHPHFLDALSVAGRAFDELQTPRGWGPELAALLHPGSPAAPLGPGHRARTASIGPLLVAASLRQHPPSNIAEILMFRDTRTWASHPHAWTNHTEETAASGELLDNRDTPPCLPARWIPQCAWEAEIPAPLDPTQPSDRALYSMILLKLGRANRWAELAFELDLPAGLAAPLAARLSHLSSDEQRAVARAAEDLATRLAQNPPPINYRDRRIRFTEALSTRPFIQAIDLGPNNLGYQTRVAARHALGRSYWQLATGGHLDFALPSALKWPRHAGPEHQPPAQQALDHLVETHAELPGDNAPLTWTPI